MIIFIIASNFEKNGLFYFTYQKQIISFQNTNAMVKGILHGHK